MMVVLQLVAEEVAVVGLQVNFYREMIAHFESLKETSRRTGLMFVLSIILNQRKVYF